MDKRSILGLIPLINLLEMEGHDPEPLLKRHDITLDNMMGNALIDRAVELEIVEDVMVLLNKPLLGIEAGKQINFTSFGPFALLIMTAPTILTACQLSVQFQSLALLSSQATLLTDKDWIEVRLTLPNCNPEIKNFIADRDLIVTYMFISEFLTASEKTLLQSGTARPKPIANQLSTYIQHAGFEPQFDQAYNWFRLPSSIARTPLPNANPIVHKIHLIQAYELMRNLGADKADITEQVKRTLSGYEGNFPSLPEIAKSLGKSERTLRRQLSDSDSSYRIILEELRKKRALDMLALEKTDVSALTQALGYTESTSFLRAFKRWTGLTPKQYLRQLRAS